VHRPTKSLFDTHEHMFYNRDVDENSLSPRDAWKALSLLRVVPSEWDPTTARSALAHVKRLQGELDAAKASLVSIVSAQSGRDTRATVVRELGVSQAEASKILRVVKVIEHIDGVAENIASGQYSADHVQRVAKLKSAEDAEALLTHASVESPEDFGKRVETFLVSSEGEERRAKQRAERSVKFFETDNGSIGIRAILPRMEGQTLRANITLLARQMYERENPKRAKIRGEHKLDPFEQRMADALIEAINGNPKADKKQKGTNGRTALIVTISLDKLNATILGSGSVELKTAMSLIDQARTDLYFCVQNEAGAVMKFGRSRRFASHFQKLALAVHQGGVCAWDSCDVTWDRCDADHDPAWIPENPGDPLGRTDLDTMNLKCSHGHHEHRHETGENMIRNPDGTWTHMKPERKLHAA
jgi:Domain of unknown function (DUF222)